MIENPTVDYKELYERLENAMEEAYDLLRAGKFNDDGYFEHIAPAEITVRSCVLDYEIDTKGFYQPVYRFDLKSTDGRYQSSVVIPAMQ